MADSSINSVKELILRCYRKTNPRELDGLTKVDGGYLTADRKWIYKLRLGGFIERERNPFSNVTIARSPGVWIKAT